MGEKPSLVDFLPPGDCTLKGYDSFSFILIDQCISINMGFLICWNWLESKKVQIMANNFLGSLNTCALLVNIENWGSWYVFLGKETATAMYLL